MFNSTVLSEKNDDRKENTVISVVVKNKEFSQTVLTNKDHLFFKNKTNFFRIR